MFAIPLGIPITVRMVLGFPDLMWTQSCCSIHFRPDFLAVESAASVLGDFSDDSAVDDHLNYLYCCHEMISIVMIAGKRSVWFQHPAKGRSQNKFNVI